MVNENTRLDSGMGFDGQGDGSRDQLAGYVVHRMGMPRYDLSGVQRKGGFSELVSRNAVVLTNRSDVQITLVKIDFDVAVPSTFR